MKQCKILILSSEINPKTQGGIQTFCRVLNEMYPASLVIVTKKTKEKELYYVKNIKEISINNFFIRVLNKLSNYMIEDYLYKKIIAQEKPNIIILNSPQKVKCIKKFNTFNILVQHTNYARYMSSKYYFRSDRKLINLTKDVIDKFVFLSPYDEKIFSKGLGLSKEKTIYIRHASNVSTYNSAKKNNKKLIMLTRLVNKYKRIDLSIKAMRKLPDYDLEIWGDGPDRCSLENLIVDFNLKNVKFMGTTSNVIEVLDNAGIYVMTSDYEGYPMSVIEALRRGLPLVVRNTFDSSRDFVHGNGVLLNTKWDEDEYVQGIRKIEENYDDFSLQSLKLGQRYNIELIKNEWDKIFKYVEEN